MHVQSDRTTFFASDLTDFLACRHLTGLERLAAHGIVTRPHTDDPVLDVLRQRGLEHESAYVAFLRQSCRSVVEIPKGSSNAFALTVTAMRAGADAIVQGRLEHESWAGWSDVLLRVPGRSVFGDWRYEPVETKLAAETRGATLLQLCLYAELLAEIQGAAPEVLRVIKPGTNFEAEEYRFAEYRSYCRLVRRNFEQALTQTLPQSPAHVIPDPQPTTHCDVCNWHRQCRKRWIDDDSVWLVAGMQKSQRNELAEWGVSTLADFARLNVPFGHTPRRGSVATLERLHSQARLQFEARSVAKPPYILLKITANHGLAALPAPSPLDIYLDLEGDRLAESGGFDYLFGYAFRGESGQEQYEALWALCAEEEKAAFERLIDLIMERKARDPSMHVYHYAPYEPTAMKRLMGRYGTRADELDILLRDKTFVDLYSVVRRGLQAGVESYSIKKLESLYGLVREVDLQGVSRKLRAVEAAIASKQTQALTPELTEAVRGYNRDDCFSAHELQVWLESLRAQAEQQDGWPVPRPQSPAAEVSETLAKSLAEIRAVAAALTKDLPTERNAAQEACWMLAQILEWHRREDKVAWWEYFRLNELPAEELLEEPSGLAGLKFVEQFDKTKRGVVTERFSFPAQHTDIREEHDVYVPGTERLGKFAAVAAIDLAGRTIDLRKAIAKADLRPSAVFTYSKIDQEVLAASLLRIGKFVRDHGIDAEGAHASARDLLLRRAPRLAEGVALRLPTETPVQAARRAVLALDHSVLAIQGPPGTGKTFTGARMIIDLVAGGKRVGITAVSHKVIRNLLKAVVAAATEEKRAVRCLHRVGEKFDYPDTGVEEETDSAKATSKILSGNYNVIGGTAFVWAKEDLAQSIDVLFVDEAGQMSLANVLACAQAAQSLVLLGDPQQLEQPQKASHPEGSEVSALSSLLGGHETMPEHLGLFLSETWRLHPALCAFTSELFYEDKLLPLPGLDAQTINGKTPFAGSGLFFVPVTHEGNKNDCIEEANKVTEILHDFLLPGVTWTDRFGAAHPLTLNDILIVAPYNAQVALISKILPGTRVGTVDKFQGQEAPIVIYSTTTSDPVDAPRGMEFLFSRNRLNVATSRAKCVCILVGNPRLFEPECRTPRQMKLANGFCRYLEVARQI